MQTGGDMTERVSNIFPQFKLTFYLNMIGNEHAILWLICESYVKT